MEIDIDKLEEMIDLIDLALDDFKCGNLDNEFEKLENLREMIYKLIPEDEIKTREIEEKWDFYR